MTGKRLSTWVWCLIMSVSMQAQREADVNGKYTLLVEEDMTWADAKRKAVEGAKSEAVKNAFGTHLTNAVVIQTTEVDGKTTSDFVERTIEESNGDWLGDCRPPELTAHFDGENLVLTAEVWGQAREILQAQADIEWSVLNSLNVNHSTNTFNDGENLYINFLSPVSGYLAIYLLDTSNAGCLLPYKQMMQGTYKVEAGKQYILFDPNRDRRCTGRYTMRTNMAVETNEIVLIFSPHPFTKAIDNRGERNQVNTLSTIDFNRWLLKCRQQDREMFIGNKIIKIINNK